MFEYIRTHQRLMQFLLLLIIFPSFAFFGIESYTRSQAAAGATVATVAGQVVAQQELDGAMREQLDKFRQMYGAQFDSKLLNTPEMKLGVLDELVGRKAIAVETVQSKLSISDAMLQQAILATPGMIKPDGSFDKERYISLLAAQGMNPALYEQRLRQDMVLEQLLGAVQNTSFVPKTISDRLALIGEQEREVALLSFKASDYLAEVKLSDEMIKAYYDKNAAQFDIPEMIKAQYVVLSNEALAERSVVSDAEIEAFYQSNQKAYSVDEQRRASHILIAAGKDASADVKAKAKAKADALLLQLRSNPSAFAKLAKENSQDPGSAERGGDLDFFGKGAMLKPFEDAVFKLSKGQISDVVQSDYGFHIIEVTDIKPASVKQLADIKTQIAGDIKKQKALKAYADAAESFGNLTYEQSDSLKPVADKLGLKIEVVDGITRSGNPAVTNPVLANPKFIKALFADDVVKKKHNTEVVEVAPNTLVAARIVDYKPASRQPLEQVRAAIISRLTQEQALVLAKQAGKARLAALLVADASSGFGEAKLVSRAKPLDIPAAALKQIMQADTRKLPAFASLEAGEAYSIYRISKVNAGTPDLEKRKAEAKQLANLIAQQELSSYIEGLKTKAKVTINKAALSTSAPVIE